MVLENPTPDLNAIRNKLNAGGRSVTWVPKHLSVSHWTRLRRIDWSRFYLHAKIRFVTVVSASWPAATRVEEKTRKICRIGVVWSTRIYLTAIPPRQKRNHEPREDSVAKSVTLYSLLYSFIIENVGLCVYLILLFPFVWFRCIWLEFYLMEFHSPPWISKQFPIWSRPLALIFH